MNPSALEILRAFAKQVASTDEARNWFMAARAALDAAAKAEAEQPPPAHIERCNAMAWNGERCVMGKDDGHSFHAAERSTWPVHR